MRLIGHLEYLGLLIGLEACCNLLHTFIYICYTVLHPYMNLKEYNPKLPKHRTGKHFSGIHARELNEHYAHYFSWSPEAKRCFAASLGITEKSLGSWMYRKLNKEKTLERSKQQLRTLHKQDQGINVSGILAFYL